MKMEIIIKRQTEFGSRQWGVYVDGKLVEGGFSSRAAAESCAAGYETDRRPEDRYFYQNER